MKVYLISMGAGVLIGMVYALLKVRSPAPPAIALIGLLGMLAGEQIITQVVRHAAAAAPASRSDRTGHPCNANGTRGGEWATYRLGIDGADGGSGGTVGDGAFFCPGRQ